MIAPDRVDLESDVAAMQHVLQLVGLEVMRAKAKFQRFNSAHEGYAVLKEEVDEMWDDVKRNRKPESLQEAIQVAAMAVRFVLDLAVPEGED